jgi:hypothetical protein
VSDREFQEAVAEIFNEPNSNTRTNGQWARLHKQFYAPFLADLHESRAKSFEARARKMTITHLLDDDSPARERVIKRVADIYGNHTAYHTTQIKRMGYHPKFYLRLWVAVFYENYLFLQLEETGKAVCASLSTVEPLDLSLSLEEYQRRFRALLAHTRLAERDLYLPQMLPDQLDIHQRSPLDLKPIWACRQLGMEPSIRSFPELASVITDLRAVEYLAPDRHAPPALLLRFSPPLYDVVSGKECGQLAVALLKKPLPSMPASGGDNEAAYINDSEQDMRSLVFKEETVLTEKAKILSQVFDLAMADRLLPRVGYSYYGLAGIRRYALIVGRTEEEQKAVQQTMQAYLEWESARLGTGLGLGRKPKTNAFRKETKRKMQYWQAMAPVLHVFGMPEGLANQQTKQRIQMLAARKGLLEIARDEHFNPAARIFVSCVSGDDGRRLVVHTTDAKRLAQRLDKAAANLKSAGSLINRLMASCQNNDERAVFLYLVNLGVSMSLPANPKKPFIRTRVREIETGLCEHYSKEEQKEIQDFLRYTRVELQIDVPSIRAKQPEVLEGKIQDLYHWLRFIRYHQQGKNDEALGLSGCFSPELRRSLDCLMKPILEAKEQERRNEARKLVHHIRDAVKAARKPSTRETLLQQVRDAQRRLEDFPDLKRKVSVIEYRILPPRMKAAREIFEDPDLAQDLADSHNQMLKRFLATVSQGRPFAKEEKVRRHLEAQVKRAPNVGGLHARVLTRLFS